MKEEGSSHIPSEEKQPSKNLSSHPSKDKALWHRQGHTEFTGAKNNSKNPSKVNSLCGRAWWFGFCLKWKWNTEYRRNEIHWHDCPKLSVASMIKLCLPPSPPVTGSKAQNQIKFGFESGW
jgi:hypothetical protein